MPLRELPRTATALPMLVRGFIAIGQGAHRPLDGRVTVIAT
jgi:hypothetical protein